MLAHIHQRELLPPPRGTDEALRHFPLATRVRVCDLLLHDLHSNRSRLASLQQEPPQVAWLLETLSHALTLPFYSLADSATRSAASSNATAAKALQIYHGWFVGQNLPSYMQDDAAPSALQALLRRCMENLSLIFECDKKVRSFDSDAAAGDGAKNAAPSSKESGRTFDKGRPFESHLDLCQRALVALEALLQRVQVSTRAITNQDRAWSSSSPVSRRGCLIKIFFGADQSNRRVCAIWKATAGILYCGCSSALVTGYFPRPKGTKIMSSEMLWPFRWCMSFWDRKYRACSTVASTEVPGLSSLGTFSAGHIAHPSWLPGIAQWHRLRCYFARIS